MRRIFICIVITISSTSWMGCSLSNHNLHKNPLVGSFGSKARPATVDRQLALARLSERHGQPGKAEQIYQNVISQVPNETMAHQRLAILAAQRGQFEVAMKHFENAKRSGEPSANLLGDIGYAYYLQHKLPEAEAHFRQALQADPNDQRARTNLGLVLGEQGRFEESLAEFQQAGDEASAYSNLAFVQSQVGNLRDAEANYHRALKINPKNRNAAEALIQVVAKNKALSTPAPTNPRGVHATERALATRPIAPQGPNARQSAAPQVQQAVAQVSKAPQGAAIAQSRNGNPQVARAAANRTAPARQQPVVPRNNMSRSPKAGTPAPQARNATTRVAQAQRTAKPAAKPAAKPVAAPASTAQRKAGNPSLVQVSEVPTPLRIENNPFLQKGKGSIKMHTPAAQVKTIQMTMPTAVPIHHTKTGRSLPNQPTPPAVVKPGTPSTHQQGAASQTRPAAQGTISLSDGQSGKQTLGAPQSSRIPPSLTKQPTRNHVPSSLILPRGVSITR